ncbi:hypothetical protein QJS04_geneDACA014612 [Acorus gramineus]|uniref:Uncharacterized protein n=1 Tax=Acorus gramineus TaxID=55184 RepID=A0AAV9ARI5_ACOGR|nr:hypothetical protein QJS04_geneDACA014612 [Acorus gramineus]
MEATAKTSAPMYPFVNVNELFKDDEEEAPATIKEALIKIPGVIDLHEEWNSPPAT